MTMYFDFQGLKQQEVLNKIKDKYIALNIFRIQDDDSMLVGETLSLYMNLFSSNDYKKNDKIMYKYFNANMTEEASLDFG